MERVDSHIKRVDTDRYDVRLHTHNLELFALPNLGKPLNATLLLFSMPHQNESAGVTGRGCQHQYNSLNKPNTCLLYI